MDGEFISRLEAVLQRLEIVAVNEDDEQEGGALVVGSVREILNPEVSPSLIAYDAMLDGELAKFSETSRSIGAEVDAIAQLARAAFLNQRELLKMASRCKKPPQSALTTLLQPTATQVTAIQSFRDNNRTSPFFVHLSAVSEVIPTLGWVMITPTPVPYIGDMIEAGKFYTNKVLKEYKDCPDAGVHKEWVKAWIGTISELQAYVKQFHTTGVEWNKLGVDDTTQCCGDSPGVTKGVHKSADESHTSNLDSKHSNAVPPRCSTHADGGTKTVPQNLSGSASPRKNKPVPNPKPVTMRSNPIALPLCEKTSARSAESSVARNTTAASKPPKLELEGNKWLVEYQSGNAGLVIDQAEMKHAVSVYKCDNCVLHVKGKVNTIMMNGCKKMALVFDEVISSVDFVNCQSVQAQVFGRVPTISIDKTDGCLIYLNRDSLDVRIITAKSSEMNILVPGEEVEGDFKEFAIPEQFRTQWDGTKLQTETSDLSLG